MYLMLNIKMIVTLLDAAFNDVIVSVHGSKTTALALDTRHATRDTRQAVTHRRLELPTPTSGSEASFILPKGQSLD